MARRPIERKIKQGLEKKFKAEGIKREAVLNQLLKIIMRGEVPKTIDKNPYDTIVGYNIVKLKKPLTKMTLGEIRANGRDIVNKTKGKVNDPEGGGSSAVGAFQILSNEFNKDPKDGVKKVIPYSSNLGRLQKLAGLSDDTFFTPEVQRTLAKELILNIADKELTEYVRKPSKKNASALISRIGRNGNPRNKNTDGWASITDLEYVGRSTTKTPKLNYGKSYIEKLVETYSKESSSKDTTEDQMENLGLSSERSQTQSNPSEDKINENVDNLVDRFRSIVKEREPEGVFGGAFSVNPDGSITNNEAIDDQEADDVFPNTDTRDEQEAEDIYKFSIPKVERKDTSDSGGGFNIMSKAEASEQPNVSIDPISTDDMFKEMIKTLPRMAKTASKTKKQKIIESIREGLKTPEIEEVESPDVDQEMDRLLRDTSTMDEKERAMLTSGMDPELLDDDPPKTEDDLRDASKEDLEAPFIVGTAEEDNRDAALGGDNLFKFDEGEDEDMQPMSFPEEQIDTTIDPFTEDDNLERERFTRQTEDEPEDSGDFSFFRSLFTNEDTDTDFFADEAQPLGGEADPNEDVLRFDEGGTADFDGKKEEDDDEGDPPPLAKPEEVADDIPAMLSEGEYVLPANVVRYLGLERIMDMHRQVLSEIQQMEDLGMIQNVDKNGEPEEDDKEMKFLEPEEGEEAVSKGTLIIASSKPKGMMCPEPLMMQEGGDTGAGDVEDPTDTVDDQGQDDEGDDEGTDTTSSSGGITDEGVEDMEEAEGTEDTEDVGVGDFGGYSATEAEYMGIENPNIAQSALMGIYSGLKAIGMPGIDNPPDPDMYNEPDDLGSSESEEKLDGDIKEEEIKTTGLEDLLNNNIYIEGVGYVPRSQAGLMSQTTV